MGLLLTFLKIAADFITAGSGIYGLVKKFKDEQGKITPEGRIALVGIVAGLLVSISISVLERIKSGRDAADARVAAAQAEGRIKDAFQQGQADVKSKYETETNRIMRPIGHFHVALSAQRTFTSVHYLRKLRDYLASQEGMSRLTTFKDLPPSVVEDSDVRHMTGPLYQFAIYRAGSGAKCSRIEGAADLSFDEPDYLSPLRDKPNVYLSYVTGKKPGPDDNPGDYEPKDRLVVTEEYDLHLAASSQQVTSTEDLPGAVLWIRQKEYIERWDLQDGRLTLADGVAFPFSSEDRFPQGAIFASRGRSIPMRETDYCYAFPGNEAKTVR
ncbi:MAG TPA: hypothetical protein VEG64_05705 [Candidatus Sulfotelmatobacter sp.]|nr:hypothetical protein [Candidatus Sulfotelmatobacter sp.]